MHSGILATRRWRPLAPVRGFEPRTSWLTATPPHPGSRPESWWNNGVTLLAQRSCKDRLHPCVCPVVPGRGFEPRSPALQAGAFTRLAFRANSTLGNWPSRGDSNTRPHGPEPCAHLLLSYATLNWWTTTVTIRVRSLKRQVHHLNACGPSRLTGRPSSSLNTR